MHVDRLEDPLTTSAKAIVIQLSLFSLMLNATVEFSIRVSASSFRT